MLVFAFIVSEAGAQEKQFTNEKYKFKLDLPAEALIGETGLDAVFEFRGIEKTFGQNALFFLKRVISIKMTPIEKMEDYLKQDSTVEAFDKDFISTMKQSFPDIKSLDKFFSYFNERPGIQGTYTFKVGGEEIKGRYLLLLVKNQSSVYVFSWASRTSSFENWNKVAEKSLGSLKTF